MSDETVTGAETTRENDDGREVLRRVRRRGVALVTFIFLTVILIGSLTGFIKIETLKAIEPLLKEVLKTTLSSSSSSSSSVGYNETTLA